MFTKLFLNTHGALYLMGECHKWSQVDQVMHYLSMIDRLWMTCFSNKLLLLNHIYFSSLVYFTCELENSTNKET